MRDQQIVSFQFKSGCQSNKTRMLDVFLFILQALFAILDFCFFLSSVIGNSVVIYVIGRDKNLKNKSSYHILSVACADLIIGLFGIPLGVFAVSECL